VAALVAGRGLRGLHGPTPRGVLTYDRLWRWTGVGLSDSRKPTMHPQFAVRCRYSLATGKYKTVPMMTQNSDQRHQENLKILFYTFLHFFVKKLKKYEKDKSFTCQTTF